MRHDRGFTLVEILFAVVIIGLLASIAIPGLLRSRAAGNAASAVGSLRAINGGQASYAAACGAGMYAPSLTNLGTLPVSGGDYFIAPDLAADPVTKSNYVIEMTPGPAAVGTPASCNGAAAGSTVTTYYVAADPINIAGARHYGTNQDGTIFQGDTALPVTQNGTPAGSAPIQ